MNKPRTIRQMSDRELSDLEIKRSKAYKEARDAVAAGSPVPKQPTPAVQKLVDNHIARLYKTQVPAGIQ